MMQIPTKYSQWVDVLEMLKSGNNDNETIAVMKAGTIEWQSGVAERFLNKLIDALNARMNHASDSFQKGIKRAGGQESLIVQELIKLRREMNFLLNVADIQALPDEQRSECVQLIQEQMKKMQDSLLESAKYDRTGEILSIIRKHPICN